MRRGNVGRVEGEEVDDLDRGILTKKELTHILSPRQMTRPGIAE